MKHEGLISIGIAILILLYSFCFEIWPAHQEMLNLQKQNRSLHEQKKTLNLQTAGWNSEDFYHWFMGQHFAGVQLTALSDQENKIQVSLEGGVNALFQLLQPLAQSQFSQFSESHLQESHSKLSISFTVMNVLPSISRKIGVVHQHGEIFCVWTVDGHAVLKKEASC